MNQASPIAEIDAAVLQAVVTIGLTAVAAFLYRRYHKPYFAWFTVAFGLYVLRLGVIMAFLITEAWAWLYWHQVATGWTALALLWAAQLFSRPRPWRPVYAIALLFPVAWSYAAIYMLDNFLWAALPAVVFLSIVTAWTGAVFLAHWRRTRMTGAAVLGMSFMLWAVHHLDYPFLRARGAWVPWGYYIDIAFLLLVGAGLLILVLDDQRGGLRAMMALAEPARATGAVTDVHQLLQRAATLPAATGAAIFSATEGALAAQAIGVCSPWTREPAPVGLRELLRDVLASDRPVVRTAVGDTVATGDGATAYRAALPIPRETGDRQILVVVGEARHPFSALDDEVLVALGRQLGSALDGTELNARLKARTVELSHLSKRMIQQHEEERRRLSLELHDETAQVFSAVKLKLGVIGEQVDAEAARSIAAVSQLVDQGMQSIRSVTEMLRPAALDDLGLEAALRSLALEFEESTGIDVRLTTRGDTHTIEADAELALFRAMQEGLSNVARHANARHVTASLTMDAGRAVLVLSDDGDATPAVVDIDRLQRNGHMGLAGIRERAESLGGRFTAERGAHGGLQITLELPGRPAPSA
jgi:signal transduction histidine kinase